ncbi:hypothetical protein DC522_10040 [Microvirga sp. KLBC 81]|uniref:hypothetical protein n=1 Tax=Microvirga sp. KLBC 81 TaxID=1862707 RepID=UPI000D51CD0F|nr:hypothetical protein [Microvirga sp. KLBC 81]PVE24429.1 hypothetical protein DC522_10040 [Microvirga sp. KLBC 81]
MMRKGTITAFKRAVLTVLMAYALVLQTILVSLSGAAHAAEAAGPQGILCLQDGRAQPDHGPATTHDGLCCTLSCHGPGPAGPAPETVPTQRLAPVALDVRVLVDPFLTRLSSNVLPVGSRAPPRLA